MEATTYVAIPQEQWQRIINTLDRVEELLQPKPDDEFLTTDKACKMLGVTRNTFVSYRHKFSIPVSQVGRNILVRKSDIIKLINERNL